MNKESRIFILANGLEVAVDGVSGIFAEHRLEQISKCIDQMWVIGQAELTMVFIWQYLMDVHVVVQSNEIGLVVDVQNRRFDAADVLTLK